MSTTTKTNSRVFYLCRKGAPQSAMRLDREPTAQELTVFAGAGLELATVGDRYRKTVRCAVNGDGYWYTRCEVLDSAGLCVGTFEIEDGPRGVL